MAAMSLPRSLRVGYGIGSFCTGTFATVPGLLLHYYLTHLFGVGGFLAGLVVFLPKLWDLLINPYVGRLSDRTVSRFGPRRPWLLAGAATLPVFFALTFAGPPLTGGAAAGYVGAMFFLAATCYALFEVPYKAMPPEMTGDYHERSALLTWRMVFLGLAILLSGGVAPIIADPDARDPAGYRLMGLVIAGVLLVAMVATFFGTARAPRVAHATGGPAGGTGEAGRPGAGADSGPAGSTLRGQLAVARTSARYLWLLAITAAQMLATGILLAGAPYFATYQMDDPDAVTPLFLSLVGPILVVIPLWIKVSRRFDKRGAMAIAAAMFALGSMAIVPTHWVGNAWAYPWVMVIGVGYAGMQLLQFSMMSDVIAADELETGQRRAGVFTGLWTAIETVVAALGAVLLGVVLEVFGFVATDPAHPVTQPESAILGVVLGGALLPAVLTLLSLGLLRRYDLSAERFAALRAGGEQRPEPAAG